MAIFVNSNNALLAERWRPFGKGRIKPVNIGAGLSVNQTSLADSIIEQMLGSHPLE